MTNTAKKTWGGSRKGSGRKTDLTGALTKSIVLDIPSLEAIYAFILGNPKIDSSGAKTALSVSEAVRQLVQR